jgi:hypothetical protein
MFSADNVCMTHEQGNDMTKAQCKKALISDLDARAIECRERIQSQLAESTNPQVAAMLNKNQGYLMALEDIADLLHSRKIF